MRFKPQGARRHDRINTRLVPPCRLVAGAMDFAMVATAQRDGELIADLAAERSTLRETQMMGVGWTSTTNQTRLLRDIPDVVAVADTAWLGESESAFVDCAGAPSF